MGWPTFLNGKTGGAVLCAFALGCANEARAAGGAPEEAQAARAGDTGAATERTPAALVSLVETHRLQRRPRFISVAPREARVGSSYDYGVETMDPDGDEVRLVLLKAPEGAALEGSLLRWQPSRAQAGRRQRFTLRAVDSRGAVRTQTWTVVPRPAGKHPAEAMRHR